MDRSITDHIIDDFFLREANNSDNEITMAWAKYRVLGLVIGLAITVVFVVPSDSRALATLVLIYAAIFGVGAISNRRREQINRDSVWIQREREDRPVLDHIVDEAVIRGDPVAKPEMQDTHVQTRKYAFIAACALLPAPIYLVSPGVGAAVSLVVSLMSWGNVEGRIAEKRVDQASLDNYVCCDDYLIRV